MTFNGDGFDSATPKNPRVCMSNLQKVRKIKNKNQLKIVVGDHYLHRIIGVKLN